MALSQSAIARLYLFGALLGAIAGGVYDFFRAFRQQNSCAASKKLQKIELPLLPKKKERKRRRGLGVVIFIEDFLFCVLSGIALAILFYEWNDGVVRLPVILVFLGGFFLCRIALGRFFSAVSEVALFCLETTVRYLFFFLFYPIRALGKLLLRFGKFITLKLRSRILKLLRAGFYKRELRKLERGAGLFEWRLPQTPGKKRGKPYENRKKEAVQPVDGSPDLSCGSGRDLGRRVRHQHHEVQSTASRREGA